MTDRRRVAAKSVLRTVVAWLVLSGLCLSSALAAVHSCHAPFGAAAADTALQADTGPDEMPMGGCDRACRCVCHYHNGLVATASPVPTLFFATDRFSAAPSIGAAVTPSTPRRPPKH